MNNPTMVTEEMTVEVCKIGQGHDCCRYLTMTPRQGWTCEKHTSWKNHLDDRVASKTITARGDNCPGVLENPGLAG